jgi:hypothetical protein
MRASELYALHVEEERYHQAHEYLDRARRALPPGSPVRTSLDAIAAGIAGEWRAAREALVRLHQLGDEFGREVHPTSLVPPTSTTPNACPSGAPPSSITLAASLTQPATL